MIDFKLPSLGADMDSGTLLSWHVKPGDTVKRGQVVAVVDTSKAAVDVEIWFDGVLHDLLVQPGETVPVGTVLARVLVPGDQAPAQTTAPAQAAVAPPSTPQTGALPKQQAVVTLARRAVSPAARQRALALGMNPETVHGSGAQGAVTLADIEAVAQAVPTTAAAPPCGA